MTTQTAAELAISRARAALILDEVFFGTLALRLEVIADPARTSTMGTDGRRLVYNPAWVESRAKNPEHLKFIIGHECMHVAMMHHLRRGHRDPRKWNIAADFAIDPVLAQAGFVAPPDAHINPDFAGMAAEQIYARLPADPQGSGQDQSSGAPGGQGEGEPSPGEVWDLPGEDGATASPAELAAAEAEVKTAVLQATQAAKAAGKLPGFARDLAAGIRAPEIDWRDALRRYMTALTRSDYSWRRANVRHLATGDWLPSLASEAMGEVLVALDTSGSISAAEQAAWLAELNSIIEDVKPERVHVAYFHSAVYKGEEFGPDDYPVRFSGLESGGTAFSPIWAHAAERGINPVCAIVLTDLECYDFGSDPGFPVLWVSTSKTAAPFGEVVRLRLQ